MYYIHNPELYVLKRNIGVKKKPNCKVTNFENRPILHQKQTFTDPFLRKIQRFYRVMLEKIQTRQPFKIFFIFKDLFNINHIIVIMNGLLSLLYEQDQRSTAPT